MRSLAEIFFTLINCFGLHCKRIPTLSKILGTNWLQLLGAGANKEIDWMTQYANERKCLA
jgi:hypothetical protein